jgi:transposase
LRERIGRSSHNFSKPRKISYGVHPRQGAICCSRLRTVTSTLRQQGRDGWQFLEQAGMAHHRGGGMPSLLPDSCFSF